MELTVELEPCGREISSTVIEGAESGNLILTSGVCQSQAFSPGVTDSYYGVVEHTPSLVETGKTGLPDCWEEGVGGDQGGPGGASYLVLAKTHHLWQRQTDAKKK